MNGKHEISLGAVALALFLALSQSMAAPMAGDAEAATHGDEAAGVQLVKETEQKDADFVFRQYNLGVLSHYSYLLGSGGEAMIVDPARDVSRYLQDATGVSISTGSTRMSRVASYASSVTSSSTRRR